ncbi:hypothetical protein [Microbacterium binotii]|uniref:hypothetical protein n=1 Tax=Microbacterium binotii TaxID=462710 RepID=UPI001F223251|nr:hypothetical protein [Microbacterium binotii]UIN30320.1 hypothetical protein LXM64_14440 [Microbacterium binotii]
MSAEPPAAWAPDVREAMKGVANFQVSAPITLIAGCLWDFGEDELAERALAMSADDHAAILRIAAVYENPRHPLPVVGRNITHGHVNALAAIAYFEGALRPLAQNRRRPQKNRPDRFRTPPPVRDHEGDA